MCLFFIYFIIRAFIIEEQLASIEDWRGTKG